LIINGSPRGERSLSRQLAASFLEHWRAKGVEGLVVERNVGQDPPPFVTEDWIAAAFTPPSERSAAMRSVLSYSDAAIAELKEADTLVLASPMHNYALPAALKAWIDQIVRIHETFTFDLARGDFPLEPVLGGKRLVVLTSSGEFGFGPGELRGAMNHLHPHVDTVKHYLGVSHTWSASIEYQEFGDHRFEASKAEALAALPGIVDAVVASYS
tara:strand:+ start:636 stop:1274 length:639 start_codon:yes stop_codon:yes gene_type:complete